MEWHLKNILEIVFRPNYTILRVNKTRKLKPNFIRKIRRGRVVEPRSIYKNIKVNFSLGHFLKNHTSPNMKEVHFGDGRKKVSENTIFHFLCWIENKKLVIYRLL
jgi:hypothetical protein